ncbi:DUF4870 domain-containing protein [Salinirubellus sp. GCM10025818]|jgi:uncharacterized membrane protein|uniref:DUF4870 domain-containing protein n=1 Tax=Salinirubellus TaxID=2162630 RepID=UPI0030D214AA
MSTTDVTDGAVASTHSSESGLDENVAGALSYLLGAITGVIFLVIEKENAFVRYHAAQSVVLSVAAFLVYVVLSVISTVITAVLFAGGGSLLFGLLSLLMTLLWLAVTLVAFGAWIYLMFRAYRGETVRIPVLAGFADRIA